MASPVSISKERREEIAGIAAAAISQLQHDIDRGRRFTINQDDYKQIIVSALTEAASAPAPEVEPWTQYTEFGFQKRMLGIICPYDAESILGAHNSSLASLRGELEEAKAKLVLLEKEAASESVRPVLQKALALVSFPETGLQDECAKCHKPVHVDLETEWDDGDICGDCALGVARDVKELLSDHFNATGAPPISKETEWTAIDLLRSRLKKAEAALAWYQEIAASIQRYCQQGNVDSQIACMKELELDGGIRAVKVWQ